MALCPAIAVDILRWTQANPYVLQAAGVAVESYRGVITFVLISSVGLDGLVRMLYGHGMDTFGRLAILLIFVTKYSC